MDIRDYLIELAVSNSLIDNIKLDHVIAALSDEEKVKLKKTIDFCYAERAFNDSRIDSYARESNMLTRLTLIEQHDIPSLSRVCLSELTEFYLQRREYSKCLEYAVKEGALSFTPKERYLSSRKIVIASMAILDINKASEAAKQMINAIIEQSLNVEDEAECVEPDAEATYFVFILWLLGSVEFNHQFSRIDFVTKLNPYDREAFKYLLLCSKPYQKNNIMQLPGMSWIGDPVSFAAGKGLDAFKQYLHLDPWLGESSDHLIDRIRQNLKKKLRTVILNVQMCGDKETRELIEEAIA